MSNAPSTLDTPLADERPDERPSNALDAARSALDAAARPLQFAGFWSAVLLPMLYVPALLGGFAERGAVFGVLLAVHAVALVAGHGYRNDD